MIVDDPFKVFNGIRQTYIRYLNSPFRVRYSKLMQERQSLLDRDNQLYRYPIFEPFAPYRSSGYTFAQACVKLGIHSDAANFITSGDGFFPASRELYTHQYQALNLSRQGKAVVITSGTGSGKTECYLLPVFSYLAEESLRWGIPNPLPNQWDWWNGSGQQRIIQRDHETNTRPKAVRALFLYPLNALIEDQLTRIRRGCDNLAATKWRQKFRNGNRFWFGRYVGATPVSGPLTVIKDGKVKPNQSKRNELKQRLKAISKDWADAQVSANLRSKEDILYYFQNPNSSEMWSRWDMQDSPPDVLITNYSMLNIMLMRSLETNIFESTRQWLQQDPEKNIFHLVVDELHTYRGTPGTEVGYLLRAFLNRLGLTPDHPQLRIIATSASIENDPESLEYLEQFFGKDRTQFEILSGEKQSYDPPAIPVHPLQAYRKVFADLNQSIEQGTELLDTVESLASALNISHGNQPPEQTINQCLESVCAYGALMDCTKNQPFAVQEIEGVQSLAELAFGDSQTIDAAQGLVRALVLARNALDEAPLPLRVHYFFHNAGRIWACVNPKCHGHAEVCGEEDSVPVGKLFVEPQPRCDECGSRVLELLYCQPCGEVFLGGYKSEDEQNQNTWFLSPDYPHLERVPDRSSTLDRKSGEFMVFWPANGRKIVRRSPPSSQNLEWQEETIPGYKWQPASLRLDGCLRFGPPFPKTVLGYSFIAPIDDANAFPSRCPHCEANYAGKKLSSPIRDLGSGFQRIVQVLCDAMMRQMPEDSRKLVLFSDSRSDAAKLSTGIKRDHYLDTVRQLAYGRVEYEASRALVVYTENLTQYQLAIEFYQLQSALMQGLPPNLQRLQQLYQQLPAEVIGALSTYAAPGNSATAPDILIPPTEPGTFIPIRFNTVLDAVRSGLLLNGMNPGGPGLSAKEYKPNDQPRIFWSELIDWKLSTPNYKQDLQPIDLTLRNTIEKDLNESVVESVLFSGGGRDFESLKLGFLWISSQEPVTLIEQVAASVLRLLLQRRRWTGSDNSGGQGSPPGYVNQYLNAVAEHMGEDKQQLELDVTSILGTILEQWLVKPQNLFVLSPPPCNEGIPIYECSRCGRVHLHASARVCTNCRNSLSSDLNVHYLEKQQFDYYEFLARTKEKPFRLNCEELTGQTDVDDRRKRQRYFQDVFMQNENEKVFGVDLLSVTTTMEAGVDIGSLQGIGMANMPPVRFNYQQRVGRAGRRRGLGMSVALTLCRGRSHDDYYFERPMLITAELPPKPYVDVSRTEIARRVVSKEILHRAFRTIQLPYSGESVHGEFGTIGEWEQQHRSIVSEWIQSNLLEVTEICETIHRRTENISLAALISHVQNQLLLCIDQVVQNFITRPQLALSERLAARGILPMFGFPTATRYLYHKEPKVDYTQGWPPKGVVDRELDIAISQFSPGAQTVKDDRLLTAVGIIDPYPQGNKIVYEPDPLGDFQSVGICRQCQALEPNSSAYGGCPYCGAARGNDGYKVIDITQPPGFATWWRINAEYKGAFEFTPRALRARLGTEATDLIQFRNFDIRCIEQAEVYRINDRDGKDFIFHKVENQNFWVNEDGLNQARSTLDRSEQQAVKLPRLDLQVQPIRRALASISITDVLVAGIQDIPVGLNLNPGASQGRAAWYSFGFLIRRAAAVRLDIEDSELDVGIQPFADFMSPFAPPSARIFISDKLDNGAGYSSWLADPARFEDLLQFILDPNRQFYSPLVSSSHRQECATSCHRCLREFGNMAFHPLLDWRIALDMVRLALDADTQIDLNYDYWSDLVGITAEAYFKGLDFEYNPSETLGGLPFGFDEETNRAVILTHPLWDIHEANLRPEVAAAYAEAEQQGWQPVLRSIFNAIRFPYE
jgi:DEAD/DEAH box helicase domain-containing protein